MYGIYPYYPYNYGNNDGLGSGWIWAIIIVIIIIFFIWGGNNNCCNNGNGCR